MPELPEVETVRRGLAPVLVGHTFARVEQRRGDLRFPLPAGFTGLRGRTVERLERRAKYLLAYLSDGQVLLMHLGMTGRFTIAAADAKRNPGRFVHAVSAAAKHDHVVFHMQDGATITYNDARRFGFMLLIPTDELNAHPLMQGLGAEPLGPDLTPAYLARRAAGRGVDLKAFLSDQRTIAGLGNIYVCEALFRAGLSPKRAAASLATKSGRPTERAERLAEAIRAVLDRCHCRGRFVVTRLSRGRRRAGHVSTHVRRLWTRGSAVRAGRLHRHRTAHRAERTLDLLLSQVPALRRFAHSATTARLFRRR